MTSAREAEGHAEAERAGHEQCEAFVVLLVVHGEFHDVHILPVFRQMAVPHFLIW